MREAFIGIDVTDSGCGMSEEVQEHIFEPFYSTKPASRGTGLGLATVHGVIRQNGGTITVKSELGKGTRFEMVLPAVELHVDEAPDSNTIHEVPAKICVLVIEDDDTVRHTVSRFLTSSGFEVVTCRGLSDALEQLSNGHDIQLILSDVILEHESGPKTVAALRGHCPDAPVIFMSGHTHERVSKERVDLGGNAFIAKPFSRKELLGKVHEALDDTPGNGVD